LPNVLRIEELGRRFGDHEVVTSLDLTLEPGQRVALRGPNGSGKTTVLRCVAGTLTPTRGRISVAGNPAGSIESHRLIGVSFSQERAFYLRLSGHDNLLFFARLRYGSRSKAAREVQRLTEELELGRFARARVDHCSTGMIQQLSFARALLGSPRLVLLDEPTRSLDSEAVARLWSAFDRRPDVALLLATHRAEDVDRCHETIKLPT
jgi:ABC-2 type transport system ATP-binding protein